MNTAVRINSVVDQIEDIVCDIFGKGRVGVLWRLAETCASIPECQSRVCRVIVKGIHEWKRNADKSARGRGSVRHHLAAHP